jgi:hypothetical protein
MPDSHKKDKYQEIFSINIEEICLVPAHTQPNVSLFPLITIQFTKNKCTSLHEDITKRANMSTRNKENQI